MSKEIHVNKNVRSQLQQKFKFYTNGNDLHKNIPIKTSYNQAYTYRVEQKSESINRDQPIQSSKLRVLSLKDPLTKSLYSSINKSHQSRNSSPFGVKEVQKLKYAVINNIQDTIFNNKECINAALKAQSFSQILKSSLKLFEACVLDQNKQQFVDLLLFLAQYAQESENDTQSVFLLKQTLNLTEIFSMFDRKLSALIMLAEIAHRKQFHQISIQILRKALLYSWMLNDFSRETLIYDQLGLNFFYTGKIKKANYFHKRFLTADCEPEKGYYRQMSSQFISFYQKELRYLADSFDKVVMMQISLPIVNSFEQDSINLCDSYKVSKINHCNIDQMFASLLESREFTQYDYEYSFNSNPTTIRQTKKDDQYYHAPKYILLMEERMFKKHKNVQKSNHSTDNKYWRELPQEDEAQIYDKINASIRSKNMQIGDKSEQILMRHLQNKQRDFSKLNYEIKLKELNKIFNDQF